jgi:thiol:disulfide interchange protein
MRTSLLSLVTVGFLTLVGGGTQLASAQGKSDRITFQVSVVPSDPFDPAMESKAGPMKVRRGQLVKVVVEARLKEGFHTYPLTQRTARQEEADLWSLDLNSAKAEAPPIKGLVPLWPVQENPSPEFVDVVDNKITLTKLEHRKPFTWVQEMLVLPEAPTGNLEMPIKLRGTVCNGNNCLPIREEVKAVFNVSAEEALPIEAKLLERRNETEPPTTIITIPGQEAVSPPEKGPKETPVASQPKEKESVFSLIQVGEEEYQKQMEELASKIPTVQGNESSNLLGFILAGIFWGGISLITPCVFPMIPITVSFFLKQSEKEHHRPVTMALVYSGTIVIVLTLAAAFLLSVFRILSINPIMNYGLGILFVFFALSLFGMYDIELPKGLARFTSAHEGQGGLIGTMFMALTFTIISFACVAPFLGGFGGTAAGTARPMWHNLLGGLAFSITFAAPFFFLALFPTLLRKMPKSGSWLNSVKVVMGFLELAAAIKFFRSAELVLTGSEPWLFTFDLAMGIYLCLCLLCGLYLLGLFRLPHDSPEEHLSAVRMLTAGLFFSLGFHLLPALFKDPSGNNLRPQGSVYAWVDSFLLPDSQSGKEEPHTGNLVAAVKQARETREKTGKVQRIFVDFTGVSCQNCSLNERYVFSKANIHELFKPFTIVKLYTDSVPNRYYSPEIGEQAIARRKADADINQTFQTKVFNNAQLPLYVILEPEVDGTVRAVGIYDEGRILNEPAFIQFLRPTKK